MNLSDLRNRLLFPLVAIPVGWAIINANFSVLPKDIATVYPGQLFGIVLILLACFEYIRMLGIFYPTNAFWFTYIWIGLQCFLFLTDSALPANLGFFLLFILVAIESFFWGKQNRRKRWVRASLMFSGSAFLYIAAISLLNFYREPFQSLFQTFDPPMLSQLGIILVVAATFFCDSVAYIVGSFWGRHHFSSISPNKTTEGSFAGLLASIIIASVGWIFWRNPVYPLWLGPLLGLLIGIFAQVGDLLVSLIKRYFKVKDASDIIPGHGGVLDRFDSMFFTAPIVILFAWIVNYFIGK